jgi:chromosome segregation ATPase
MLTGTAGEQTEQTGSTKEPLIIDLSGGLFRGSGAMFQSDRLTIGRTGNRYLVKGVEQVVEKVIYKENKEAEERVAFLEEQIRLLLFKYALVSAECKRLSLQPPGSGSNLDAEYQIRKLHELLKDREAELFTFKSSKTHESSDASVRMAILSQENQRLQKNTESLSTKVVSMQQEVQKLEQDSIFRPENMTRIPIVLDLAKMLESRDLELSEASDKINRLEVNITQKSDSLNAADEKLSKLAQKILEKDRDIAQLHTKLSALEKQSALQTNDFSHQSMLSYLLFV